MKILFKLTSKSRPEWFVRTVKSIVSNINNDNDYLILGTFDSDDDSMNNPYMMRVLDSFSSLYKFEYHFSASKNKIDAINRDMDKVSGWDILVNVSDDMVFQCKGFDDVIRDVFEKNFPDMDGCPGFWDGYVTTEFATLAVFGRKWYEDFGYIYNPEYANVYCDNEMTDVAKMLGRFVWIKDPLIVKHEHPSNNKTIAKDDQYLKTDSRESYVADKAIYDRRKKENFGLTKTASGYGIKAVEVKAKEVLLSILIVTIKERDAQFQKIYNKLVSMASKHGDAVEIRYFCDNRENTIGFKRNKLLQDATGKYVCFVDDDDNVSDNYIDVLVAACGSGKDCCSLVGQITTNGASPATFFHSIKYDQYKCQGGVYLRPPNHLNAIKATIAKRIEFKDISFSEDYDWTVALKTAGLIKTEEEIEDTIYFYNYISNKQAAKTPLVMRPKSSDPIVVPPQAIVKPIVVTPQAIVKPIVVTPPAVVATSETPIIGLTMYSQSHDIFVPTFLSSLQPSDVPFTICKKIQVCSTGEYTAIDFKNGIKKKIECIINFMSFLPSGKHFVYSDIDVVFKTRISEYLKHYLQFDLVFQKGVKGDNNLVSTGFMIIRNIQKNVDFFKSVLDGLNKDIKGVTSDQQVINHVIKGQYNIFDEKVSHYGLINNNMAWRGEAFDLVKDTVLFHASYTVGIENKKRMIDYVTKKV